MSLSGFPLRNQLLYGLNMKYTLTYTHTHILSVGPF